MTRVRNLVVWLGSLALVLLANLLAPISILRGGSRGWGVVQANDMALNAALGGSPVEYVSTRCARARLVGKWWGRMTCAVLDWFESGHCQASLKDTHS